MSGQSWCPECGKPFMYYPVKDEVVQVGEVWMHVHCPRAVNSCVQVCPNCDVVLEKTSGGKLQCRRCGFLLTCCD